MIWKWIGCIHTDFTDRSQTYMVSQGMGVHAKLVDTRLAAFSPSTRPGNETIHLYMYTHSHQYTFTPAPIHTSTPTHIHTSTPAHFHTSPLHTISTPAHLHTFTHIYQHTCTHSHQHTCTYSHQHIFTYSCKVTYSLWAVNVHLSSFLLSSDGHALHQPGCGDISDVGGTSKEHHHTGTGRPPLMYAYVHELLRLITGTSPSLMSSMVTRTCQCALSVDITGLELNPLFFLSFLWIYTHQTITCHTWVSTLGADGAIKDCKEIQKHDKGHQLMNCHRIGS